MSTETMKSLILVIRRDGVCRNKTETVGSQAHGNCLFKFGLDRLGGRREQICRQTNGLTAMTAYNTFYLYIYKYAKTNIEK